MCAWGQAQAMIKKKYRTRKARDRERCVLILLDQNAMQMVAHNLGLWHQHHSP
jgi:hypothetical protein